MRMIKKETLLALSLLISTYQTTVNADTCGPDACLPCGQVITNAPTVAYEPPVTPINNYIATCSTCRNPNNYFGGFYVGVGWGIGVVDWNIEIVNPGIPGVHNLQGLDSDTRSYLVGIANAGFNLVINHFALGIEAGYNYRSRTNPSSYFDLSDAYLAANPADALFVVDTPCKVRFDINSQHAATVDLLPGFVYNRFIVYARLGVEKAQYKLKRSVCFPDLDVRFSAHLPPPPLLDADIRVHDKDFVFSPPSRSETGFRLGLGFGVAACRNLSFHLNYIHTFAEKITYTPDVTALENKPTFTEPYAGWTQPNILSVLGQLGSSFIIEPQRNEVNLTMRWTF